MLSKPGKFLAIFTAFASAMFFFESPTSAQYQEYTSVDGVNLVGRPSVVDPKTAIGVVIFIASDDFVWGKYSQLLFRMNAVNMYSLMIDSRGTGSSLCKSDGTNVLAENFKPADWAMLPGDFKRIIDKSTTKFWPRNTPVYLVAAQTGANAACLTAELCPAVKGLVLLSPSSDYHGLQPEQALKNFKGRVFLACSAKDKESADFVNKFNKIIPASRLQSLVSINGTTVMKGVDLFRIEPILADKIGLFLRDSAVADAPKIVPSIPKAELTKSTNKASSSQNGKK